LAALFGTQRAELQRFLVARCGDPTEAEDLLQELWLKVAHLSTGPIANARAYLFRMANNLVLDRARGRRREMRRDRLWLEQTGLTEDDPEQSVANSIAETILMKAQEADLIRGALEALPAGARRALLLYRFEGRKQADIAQIMGISRSGVEKHLALAMKHLRQTLKDCGFFDSVASQGTDRAEDVTSSRKSRP
jgi:RNA polymerase sigma-70 factor (ECF subfamily)